MDAIVDEILRSVLGEIKPSEEDKLRLLRVYDYVSNTLERCLTASFSSKDVAITLQGSLAKDTFLKNQSDIDVFLLFDYKDEMTDKWFERELIPKIVSCLSSHRYTLNYAAHPYVTLYIDNFEINIVPAFKVRSPKEVISAVDRTPFHTNYVKSRLTEVQKDEVRLLKHFLKIWGLYGAEIEVQGFSGYLTELLILAYGTFYNLLRNAIGWQAYRTCIDIEHHYSTDEECLKKFKGNVLIVVDPVDPGRNAAAAVSLKKFSLFKLLAKLFIDRPSIEFFKEGFPETTLMETFDEYLKHRMKAYDSCLYLIIFDITRPLSDVVWGQLSRLKSSIFNSLVSYGIDRELYADIWVNPSLTNAVIVMELMQCSKGYKLHTGPPAYDVVNATKFLLKNKNADIGPWVGDDGRLYVIKRVDHSTIARIINGIVSSRVLTGIRFERLVIVNDVNKIPIADQGFLQWLKRFLERKPFKKILDLFT